MKRTNFARDRCPVARSVETVGDWWSLLIVRDAFVGVRRFGEFQKSLGVAKNILTVRLKKLVADGVMELVPASDGSAYQEYALTDRGRGLFLVIAALGQWSCSGHEFRLVDRETGQPVRLELRAEDGRALGMDDVLLAGAPKAGTGPARERGPKPPEPGGNLRQTNQCPRRMSDGG